MGSAPERDMPGLAILNYPPSRAPGPELLHQLIPSHAGGDVAAIEYRHPDGSRSSLSYEELHDASDLLAARISVAMQQQPLGNNEPFIVPVLAPQGPDLYLALLSILKAGGAFCPLALDAPPERVRFILNDVSARVVLCSSELAARIPPDASPGQILILVDKNDARGLPQTQPVNAARAPRPTDLAYVMYTSGSTGTPKGVGVSHSAATQSLLGHDRHIPAFFRFLQFAAPTFDVSVFEIFFPLFRGRTLVSCSRPDMLNDLPAVIREMDVDACELTPTVAGSLLRSRENAPALRLLLTIGEMLTQPVVEEFAGSDGQPSILWAMYGPTEAAIHCSLQPAFHAGSRVGNIGIPLDTVSAFILRIPDGDDNGNEDNPHVLSIGDVGELALGGFQLASGYLNRPDQTAAAFIDTNQYGPLYRTGDKARFNQDGTMECLGRIADGQVKLRGQRIELGEVEQAALRAPGCRGAMVAVVGSLLVLFCAVDGDRAGVRETCEQWLPAFMVPGDIVHMRELPRLPSGKVDRKRLVADYEAARDRDRSHNATVEAMDETDRELCRIVSDTLGVEVGLPTNLPMAGLDSIAAIKLASALRRAGLNVSAVEILSSRTIYQLRGAVTHRQEEHPAVEVDSGAEHRIVFDEDVLATVPELQRCVNDIDAIFPCTPLQVSMLAETASNPTAYCNWVEITVPAHFSEALIRSWISRLVETNSILRTGFVHCGGRFVQVLWKGLDPNHISTVDQLAQNFEIATESDLLHPLRVQISSPNDNDERRLLLQVHHALYDGWTVDMLLADINTLARQEDLVPRPQFTEVVAYLGSVDYAEKCDAARGFWAENLAGYQPSPFPKLAATRLESGLMASKEVALDIDPAKIKTIFREFEFGPQVLFQAALVWLWSSLVGNEDVVIGTVTSGRTIPVSQIEDIMGPCIASVPLRVDVSCVKTAGDLLATVHSANRAALPHGVLPLAEIQKVCGVLPGQSLYDVLFVYQESLYSHAGQKQEIREVDHRDAIETKVLVEVEPREGSFACRLTYHLDAVPEEQAGLLMELLQFMVRHLIADLDRNLSSTRTAIPANLISQYNMNPTAMSGIPDLAMAVEAVALHHPEKPALCFARSITENAMDAEVVSFQQLNRLGNQIARSLHGHGSTVGSVVAIVMEKSVLLYAGILGIVKAGCSYLPLLPNTPPGRMETIFAQSGVGVCLTDTASYQMINQLASDCRPIDLEAKDFQSNDNSNLDIPPDPSRIANIIYTSGSTGVPKGVCVTQLNLASNLDVLSRIYPVPEKSRLLQSCSQAFDVSVFEIFFSWTQGMCLCSAVNDTLFEDLERSIRNLGVTHLSLTPTVASLVDPANVPAVEFLVTSGEAMTETVARKWSAQLYQGYGPSETTNICTVKKMGPADIIQHLGWSFDNTSAFVLYRDGDDPVPYGCVGELCFGGDQVAQGYLKMPDLTSSKFIDHPAFGRLYRSGDVGRMLPDGSLMVIGRVDDQIKLRGQRIELNEINAVVRMADGVVDCDTLTAKREDVATDQLVSFYVFDGGRGEASTRQPLQLDDELRSVNSRLFQLLSSKVPPYMVPSYLVPIPRLPLTAAGKLDRACLRTTFQRLDQPYLETASSSIESVHDDDVEWSDSERQVADMVSSSLAVRIDDIHRWTPFTSLGLDSISAIGLSRQLRQQLSKRVPVSVILQSSCVARLAEVLKTAEGPGQESTSLNIKVFSDAFEDGIRSRCQSLTGTRVERILPCTPLQEAMLASSTYGNSYLNKMLFRLHADPETIKRCWELMCQRHGIFRTCFVSTDNTRHAIAQVVLEGWLPRWDFIDSSVGTLDDCVSLHAEHIGPAIDSMEPPVAFALITQQDRNYMSFVCHHALYDAVAVERLLFEMEQLVHGRILPPAPPLEPFLREVLSPPDTTAAFWREQLAGFQPVQLPRSKIGGASDNRRDIWECRVDAPLGEVNERSRGVGVSLLSLCQAAWASVLATVLQTDDVCFGNVVSGRSVAVDGIDALVAPCFNTVPVRMRLSGTKRNVDLMKAFQGLGPGVLEHQFTPARLVQGLVSGGLRLFDTVLLLQQPARLLDGGIWALERDDGEMDVPLVCEFIPDTRENKLSIKLHYETRSISDAMMMLISDLLRHAVNLCLDFPASHVAVSPNLPQLLVSRLLELDLNRTGPAGIEPTQDNEEGIWSETELRIRSVLSSLSSMTETSIRRQTTIYQLGLDSINAVQIASRLRKQGLPVSAGDVIEHNTAERLALHSTMKQTSAPRPTYDLASFQNQVMSELGNFGIPLDVVDAVLPCTSLQAAMLVQFVRSTGRDYFNFIELRLDRDRHSPRLADTWAMLTRTHSILRTGFVPTHHKDGPFAMVQYSADSKPPPVLAVEERNAGSFNFEKWRLDAAAACLKQLHEPPWQAAYMDGEDGLVVHLAIHHALYDAQSLRRLLDDLAPPCRGVSLPRTPPTEAVVLDILEQVQSSASGQEAFWKEHAEKIVINTFPVLTPLREETRAVLVESTTSRLPFSDLETSIRASGYTMQATIQAAWTRILSSYLGEASVTFGTVLSGRNSEATKDAVFPCITTLPVIGQNDTSNRTLLDNMLKLSADLYKQQHVPLTRVQRWLGHTNTRLFDTLLVYQRFNAEIGAEMTSSWRIVDDQANIDYPVSIEVEPMQGDRLEYRMTFFGDVLPSHQAKLLLEQFDQTVCSLVAHPDGQESDLFKSAPNLFSVMPAQEDRLPSEERFLHQFVESQARKTPHKTALRFVDGLDGSQNPLDRTWSYHDLDSNGNRVASMLLPHVKAGDIVAVHFDKCPEAFFAILGTLKTGCAFVALDPDAPAARKEFILQDSGATVILTSTETGDGMNWLTAVPVLSISESTLQAEPCGPITLAPEMLLPSDICYCLYTSGTTGTPKGCEITHENAVQAMLAFQQLFAGRWDDTSNWLQFASFHFDVAVLEQYWSWSVGITLVAAPRDLILGDLARVISSLEITHIDLTPSLARLLRPDEVPSLARGVFITGGEQLKQEILDAWGPVGVVYNAYGPTEATIGVTMYPRVPRNGRPSNIGRQFINVGSYVFKPGTEIPVLRGAVGELCVSGRLVGRGYLNRGNLTAERFPTLKNFGERAYRTGDLVRVLYDGCFDFLGRADDQVKLRGQRLEIGEINHTIRSGVADVITDVATVVARNERQQKDLLVSFVVTGSHRKEEKKGLRVITGPEAVELGKRVQGCCRDKLPGYMVPTYVLQLPYIPLSSNNKAEAKELKRLFNAMDPANLILSASSAPVGALPEQLDNATGKRILKVLARMESVDDVSRAGRLTNIFELGIDSISVMQFSMALKREGLGRATPALILKHPRLGDLANSLDSQTATAPDRSNSEPAARQLVQACHHRHKTHVLKELAVMPSQVEYIAPCSPLQEGMISRSRVSGGDGAYFNAFLFELADGISMSRLKSAWTRVHEMCAILRTRFVATTDGYVQVALAKVPFPWKELKVAPEDDIDELLRACRKTWTEANQLDIHRPLELISVETPGKSLVVVHIFHGLYDANSFDLIMDRVIDEYRGAERIDYGPPFLEGLVHGPLRSYASCKSFWIDHLKGVAPQQPFPQISDCPSHRVISCSRYFSFEELDKVRISLGVTHQAMVQAIWTAVIQPILSNAGSIGLITSGRSIDLVSSDRVIGPLFNTLPFRISVLEGETWSSLIEKCHTFNVDILPFQHVPLRDVQKWCAAGKPLFDTLFSFQRESSAATRHERTLWTELESGLDPDFPLAFEATLTADKQLQLLLVAQGGIADSEALTNMLDRIEEATWSLIQDPTRRIMQGQELQTSVGPITSTRQDENTGDDSDTTFEWTPIAVLIREELAVLAQVAAESVAPTTSLLELGLDSIDAIKLSSRLRKASVYLSTSQLMRGQTIAAFVCQLGETQTNGHSMLNGTSKLGGIATALEEYLVSVGFDFGDVERVLPVTPLQDSMTAGMIQSDFRNYFNHDILELKPDVDVTRLKAAWVTVVANSPILRTSFVAVDSPDFHAAYCQVVRSKTASPPQLVIELTSESDLDDVVEEARRRACKGAGRSDLLQLAFATVGNRRYLVLSIAHSLYDGWSLELLHRDVQAAYDGAYSPRPSYEGYLDHIIASSSSEATDFWSGFLGGAAATEVPKTTSASDSSPTRIVRAEAASSTPLSKIKAFCRLTAVSPHVLGQACWAALLATRAQALDVTFGVVLSGREAGLAEAMLFPTMNTVALRSVLHGDGRDWLRYMQENMAGIAQYQHFPLRRAGRLVGGEGGLRFNSLFLHQRRLDRDGSDEGLLAKSVGGEAEVDYAVCIEMEMDEADVIWRVACASNHLAEGDPSLLLHQLDLVMAHLVSSPAADVLVFDGNEVSVCGLPAFTVERQPGTRNGEKVEPGSDADDDPEWSETERQIRTVLAALAAVPVEAIRRWHSVYHLGLDSISAIKAGSLLRKSGIPLSARQLLRAESITEMARLASCAFASAGTNGATHDDENGVDGSTISLGDVDVVAILGRNGLDASSFEDVLPATPMQVHMLSVWQNTAGRVFYPTFHYLLRGMTDRGVIVAAWRALVRENPILRTRFVATASSSVPFVQLVAHPESGTVNGSKDGSNEETWSSQSSEQFGQSFVSMHAEFGSDAQWRLKLTIHHALYDGISLPIIMERFRALCSGNHSSDGASHHGPWKQLLALQTNGAEGERRRNFWVDYLQGAKSTLFPARQSLPSSRSKTLGGPATRTARLRRSAIPDVSSLQSVCLDRGISTQALFFAACAKFLATESNNDGDVVLGVYLANRHVVDSLEDQPYPTLCMAPLRVRGPRGVADLGALAGEVQRDIQRISSDGNGLAGLWEIRSWTGVVVDCFVNFLSLPPTNRVGAEEDIVLLEDNEEDVVPLKDYGEGVEYSMHEPDGSNLGIAGNMVKGAYPDAVDIEVSIGGTAMDIGVFGPGSLIEADGVEELVSGVVCILEEFANEHRARASTEVR